jgi:hypothetical protein
MMLRMFHTYVALFLSVCCVCFAMVFKCFKVFFASVTDTCFQVFHLYSFVCCKRASGYFKSRSRCCICVHDIGGTLGMGRDRDRHGGERGAAEDAVRWGLAAQWGRAAASDPLRRDKRSRSNRFSIAGRFHRTGGIISWELRPDTSWCRTSGC